MDPVFTHLFAPVYFQLKRAERAYQNYQKYGCTFLYAKILWDCNTTMHRTIVSNCYLIPTDLEKAFLDLTEHLDCWMLLWEDMATAQSPKINDRFVFDNHHTFPKESVDQITSFYHRLRSDHPVNDPKVI